MATGTLSIEFGSGGATVYAVVRRLTDQYVWGGSAFAAYAAGSWSTYAVAMTDDSAGLYTVDFPSAIAGGDYVVSYYQQAAGSPATTDLRLTWEEFHWDGAALTSTSTITLSAFALVTLDNLKTYLGITGTTYDTQLTFLLNGVSAEIERITGAAFVARAYREWYDCNHQRRIVLRHRPVQYVTRASYGCGNALSLAYSGSAIRASASVYRNPEVADDGGLRLVTVSTAGVTTANNLPFSTYPSASTLATAVNLVSGWTATVQNNVPSGDLYADSFSNLKSRTVMLTYPDLDVDGWRVDSRLGYLEFDQYAAGGWPGFHEGRGPHGWPGDRVMPRGFQRVLAEYNAGYVTVPADVQVVCCKLVQDVYYRSRQNTAVQSERLGDYSVTLGQRQVEETRAALAQYMDGANLIGGAV